MFDLVEVIALRVVHVCSRGARDWRVMRANVLSRLLRRSLAGVVEIRKFEGCPLSSHMSRDLAGYFLRNKLPSLRTTRSGATRFFQMSDFVCGVLGTISQNFDRVR